MGARAAPRPVEWIHDEAGVDGVEGEVTAGRDELGVTGDLACHCVRAEEVRAAPMAALWWREYSVWRRCRAWERRASGTRRSVW